MQDTSRFELRMVTFSDVNWSSNKPTPFEPPGGAKRSPHHMVSNLKKKRGRLAETVLTPRMSTQVSLPKPVTAAKKK